MSTTIHRSPLLTVMIAIVVVVACTMLHGGVRAQQAPAPMPSGPDCTQAFFNLTGCLSYVVFGSNDSVPDKECCPELAGLFDSNPICLCDLLAGGAESYGITIDNNRALNLPSICHIDTLPVGLCSEIGIPVASPTMVPSPAPSLMPLPEPTPAPPQQNLAAGFEAVDLVVAAGVSCVVAVIGIIF